MKPCADKSKLSVVHLVPFDGVGGVETAARSVGSFEDNEIAFRVQYIWDDVRPSSSALCNPFHLIAVALVLSRSDVDVLVLSLWRSALVGLLARMLRPGLRLVLFVHVTKSMHIVDRLATDLAASSAEEVWADSSRSLQERFAPPPAAAKCRVISFFPEHLAPVVARSPEPAFIFWGRLTAQKGVDRALRLFAEIRARRPEASFAIIGPDGGEKSALTALNQSLGIANCVSFHGPARLDELVEKSRRASFFLQTSQFEGMGLSVVEAMQLGLVPVVTPVGEIGVYCKNAENAVIVSSDEQAARDTVALLDDPDRYRALQSAAIETWRGRRTYRDSLLEACRGLRSQRDLNSNVASHNVRIGRPH